MEKFPALFIVIRNEIYHTIILIVNIQRITQAGLCLGSEEKITESSLKITSIAAFFSLIQSRQGRTDPDIKKGSAEHPPFLL